MMSNQQESKKIMRHSHASKDVGAQGRTIIERIEQQMDRRRKVIENHIIQHGIRSQDCVLEKERGRYEGFGAAISLLRSSSLSEEIKRSNERLGIE
jgi:hypothetical protein